MYANLNYTLLKVVGILWPISLVFMHFVLIEPITFPVVVFPLVTMWLLLNTKFELTYLLVALVLVIYASLLGMHSENSEEFMKSFILFISFISALLLASKTKLINSHFFEISLRLFVWLSFFLALFTILQAISLNLFSSYTFINPLGPFGRAGPGGEVYVPHILAVLKKSNAVFSEPSVCGWFLALAAAITINWNGSRERFKSIMPLTMLVGAGITGAMSGLLNAIIIVLFWAYLTQKGGKGLLLKGGVLLVVILAVTVLLSYAPISDRMGEISREGSSTYYRIAAPLMLLADSLPNYPFGHALGQIDYIASKSYMVNWEGGAQFGIHNSFFTIIYYFGIVGVIASLWYLYFTCRAVILKRKSSLILLALMLVFSETGGLWSPEITLLITYCILIIRHFDQSTSYPTDKTIRTTGEL